METVQHNPLPQADRYPGIAQRLPRDLEALENSIGELREKMRIMPTIDKDGNSECPFAGNLYNAMLAVANRLRAQQKYLRENESIVREEQIRRKNQLSIIKTNMRSLHADGPKQSFQHSLMEQQQRCHEIEDLQARIRSAIERAENVLRESNQCRVPAGGYHHGSFSLESASPQSSPQRHPDFPDIHNKSDYAKPVEYAPLPAANSALGPAIEGLIHLGPMGTGGPSRFGNIGD